MKHKKVDYNIEYAHIYTDEYFGKEQKKSIKELRGIIKVLKRINQSYTLAILVDEYNPKKHKLDIKDFIKKLTKFNAVPDFLVFESRLIRYKNVLLKEMKGKIKKEYEKYIERHGKIPCSFLIAIWHLKRLGLLKKNRLDFMHLGDKNKIFEAKKIITILPKRYREVEKKALEIIKSTKFRSYIDNYINIFFD